jgi:putative ABC transport system permease protein
MKAASRGHRVYRLLLRLLPRPLRAEYGVEMEALFGARLRQADGVRGRLRVWLLGVLDILGAAYGERRSARSARRRAGRVASRAWLPGISLDVSSAIRSLRRNPSYTIVTVLTLGLGIGAVTSLYAVLDGVLLSPLPYRDADRLAFVNSPFLDRDNLDAWLAGQTVAEAVSAFSITSATAETPEGAVSVSVFPAGRGFAELVGWRAQQGRMFTAGDHAEAGVPVALVTARFWRQRFGGGPAVGAMLRLDGRAYEVVGVLERDDVFRYRGVDVWLPLEHAAGRGVSLIARLGPGVDAQQAAARLLPVAERLATPESRQRIEGLRTRPVSVHDLTESLVGDVRDTLWVLFAVAALVLLLGVLNVANLSVERAVSRTDELAVRTALGSGRVGLVRLLAVEAVMLSAAGCVLGVALALGTPSLLALAPDYLPRVSEVRIDGGVLLGAAAAAAFAFLVCGVAPAIGVALRSERVSLRSGLAKHRRAGAAQGLLVVSEVAAAIVVLVGVALLAQTYFALRPTSPGFQIEDRAVATLNLPPDLYADPAAVRDFADRLITELGARAGGTVALATDLPLTGMSMYLQASRGGPDAELTGVHFRAVSAGYLEMMRMRLLAGRTLTAADVPGAPNVAVVNESAARRLWGDAADAIGRTTTLMLHDGPVEVRVVGVLADAWVLRGPVPSPVVFTAFRQLPFARFSVVIATSRERPVPEGDVLAALRAVDPRVPLLTYGTLRDSVAWSVVFPRFQATLLAVLGMLTLVLAASGIFAVLSQMIARRTPEFGIRMALGASVGAIVRSVLGRVAPLAAAGIVAGVLLAGAATRLLRTHLFGVEPGDPASYLAAIAAVTLSLLLAAVRPLVRAARVDPIATLRE